MGLFTNKYPYTDFHEMNLDFVLETISKLQSDMTDFIKYNEIKFHDPIEWDITTQYTSNTVVTNAGVAYMSKQAVPAGISIDNTDYWLAIGIFNVSIDTFRANITVYNEGAAARASRQYAIGDIIWWHDNLYYVTEIIATNDILSNSNLSITNVASELKREISARENAIESAINTLTNTTIPTAINSTVPGMISESIAEEVENRDTAIEEAIADEVEARNTAIQTKISNTKIGELKNVNANFPTNGQILKYDQASATWVNANETGGGGGNDALISNEYDAETLYNPGDYCLYLGSMFKKIGITETGVAPIEGESWTQCQVGTELTEVNSNLSVYSTSEKRIGTWIDGKPLYQKTWTGTMSADNSQTVDSTFTNSYAKPKNMFGNFSKTDYSSTNGIPFSNNTYYVYINVNEYGLKLEKNNTSWEGRKYDITIQYTKPTD